MDTDDEQFFEDEEQLETEDDVDAPNEIAFSSAVVSGNDWTTETIVSQINKGNINLSPSFQRRDAWTAARKSRFVESLILGLPIPQLVLAESREKKGSYIVLDGKQRLLSIRQFFAQKGDSDYDQLRLSGLDIRENLNSASIDDLRDDVAFEEDLTALENQPIRTIVIKNWPSEEFLYLVFLRLNTGSVPLSPQELRQALHPGEFVRYLDLKSSESNSLRDILNQQRPDFRMRDAELLLRYFAFRNYLTEYRGTLKRFLDECCLDLNRKWPKVREEIDGQFDDFECAHEVIREIFQDNAYRKWSDGRFENRFNRSIFDIMIQSFCHREVREATRGKEALVQEEFKKLCEEDQEFVNSLTTTTKSLSSTCTRFSQWNAMLNSRFGLGLSIPMLSGNRITYGS